MALSEPIEALIIYPASLPLQMAREHEDLYLIILKYYRGAELANQKGNPDYHTGYTYIKLEFATALNVRTQDIYNCL